MPATNPGSPYYPIPKKTVGQQIIEYMQTTLQAADYDPANPVTSGGPKLFERVIRGNMEDIRKEWSPSAAIEDGSEKTQQMMWPITDVIMRVYINFKIFHTMGNDLNEVGVDQFAMIRYYYGRIINLFVTEDVWMGGLALDVVPAGNNPEVNGSSDDQPGGTVIFDIHYRYQFGDMFTGGYATTP